MSGWKNICNIGVKVDYNKGNELDFGYGFYLTPNQNQAERFIKNVIKYTSDDFLKEVEHFYPIKDDTDSKTPIVIEFELKPITYFEQDEYSSWILNAYDDDFANFVFQNRTENVNRENHHHYDIIFGVMSDSNPIIDIQKYRNNKITKEEVLERFKKHTSNKQLSIHKQEICDILNVNKVLNLESGEELDFYDYNRKRSKIN